MKPSIPRGTRDMNPAEMQKRNYIFDVIIVKYMTLSGRKSYLPIVLINFQPVCY